MTEMEERVARALWDDRWPDSEWTDNAKRDFMGHARAAIDAMREPTEEMCDAPADAGNAHRARAIWTAMLDAALGRGGEEGK